MKTSSIRLGEDVTVFHEDALFIAPVCGMRMGSVYLTSTTVTPRTEDIVEVLVNGLWFRLGDVALYHPSTFAH